MQRSAHVSSPDLLVICVLKSTSTLKSNISRQQHDDAAKDVFSNAQ